MTTPLISVIVPIYNCDNYLTRCLDSIICQSYNNLEILLIDDGSTDNSSSICDYYSNLDSRIQVFHNDNVGVSMARNYGLKKVTGQYITFVDADDFISRNMIYILYVNLVVHNASIATCHNDSFDKNMIVKENEIIKKVRVLDPNEYNFCDYSAHHVVWGALFEKCILDNLSFSKEIYVGEDTLFFAQAVQNATCIIDIDAPLYHYFINSKSLSHKPYDYKRFTDVLARDLIVELFSLNSKESLLSCYGSRSLVALKGFHELCRNNTIDYSIFNLLVSFIRKDLIKALRSQIPIRSKISMLLIYIGPRLYCYIYRYIKLGVKCSRLFDNYIIRT